MINQAFPYVQINLRSVTNLFTLLLGSFIVALAINIFYIPSKFVSGGVGGIAILGFYSIGLKPSITILLFNIHLLIAGYAFLKNPSHLAFTIVGFLSNAFFLETTKRIGISLFIPDDIIRAIFGGIMIGTGSGIMLRSRGSLGGTDIIGMILREKFNMKIGMTNFIFNLAIIGVSALIFEPYKAMYSILASYFAASIADRILLGLETRKAIFIFSQYSKDISQAMKKSEGYHIILIPKIEISSEISANENFSYHYIIYTIIPSSRLAKTKELVQAIDANAFMSISEVSEAMGVWDHSQPVS